MVNYRGYTLFRVDNTMLRKIYHKLLAPKQKHEEVRNREMVLNVLLSGTLAVLLLALPVMTIGYLLARHDYMIPSFYMVLSALIFAGYLYRLSRKGMFRLAAFMLVGMYYLLAAAMVFIWGVNLPSAILLFGLVIVLAGILLGSNYSLYLAGLVVLTLIYAEIGASYGAIVPDLSWAIEPPSMGDVMGFGLVFGIIALVSWLFNHQMERSLHKAEKAEAALLKQKALLETTVEERTQELQAEQLEKITQMYRFAELGQLSTALMHDLANHLTSLTLNIESLEGKTRSKVLAQAKQTIRYIDDMVVRVRDQLHGRTNVRTFNAVHEINEIVKMLRHRGHAANVDLKWQPPEDKKSYLCRGEPIRFRQMMANLICNGIDAYDGHAQPDGRREVAVIAANNGSRLVVLVNDWGKGIPAKERKKLFQPFHSTKESGMGMGLFIVKQIAEEHFLGSVYVDPKSKHTSFVVEIPKASA